MQCEVCGAMFSAEDGCCDECGTAIEETEMHLNQEDDFDDNE
jgi:uncharacterized OB-fold protein